MLWLTTLNLGTYQHNVANLQSHQIGQGWLFPLSIPLSHLRGLCKSRPSRPHSHFSSVLYYPVPLIMPCASTRPPIHPSNHPFLADKPKPLSRHIQHPDHLDSPRHSVQFQLRPSRVPSCDTLDILWQVCLAVNGLTGRCARRELGLVACYFDRIFRPAPESFCDVSAAILRVSSVSSIDLSCDWFLHSCILHGSAIRLCPTQ